MSDLPAEPPLLEAEPCIIAAIESEQVHVSCSGRGSVVVSASSLGHRPSSPLWEGASVMLVTLRHPQAADAVVIPILEPDYLTDVTEIAETWQPSGSSPECALLSRMRTRRTTPAMARGSLLNAVFDLAVVHHDATDRELVARALQATPLPWAAFAHEGHDLEKEIDQLLPTVSAMRQQLRSWLTPAEAGSLVRLRVEPHAVSPVLGLAGRFDILREANDQVTLVELKSGKPPSTGGRHSHVAQASCYAALHLAVEGRWPDHTALWYAAVAEQGAEQGATQAIRPLQAHDILTTLRSVLLARNAIVCMDHAIANRQMSALRAIGPGLSGLSEFDRPTAVRFAQKYAEADRTVRTVCQAWLAMLHRERWVQRLGVDGQKSARSRADLWREDLDIKRADASCITDLVIDADHSNFELMHLTCRRDAPITHTSLRPGDLVVLHRQDQPNPFGRYIVKATLEAIDENSLRLSLRNKQIDQDDLVHAQWIVEADVTDKSLRDAMPGAVALLTMQPDRQQLLLGSRPTHHTHADQPLSNVSLIEGMTPHQRQVLQAAVDQQELFLLQGPPGTGKTTIALRSIVEYLVRTTTERVLVLAYTNRAVSEICSALSTVLTDTELLRHGSKSGSNETRSVASIPVLGRVLSPSELAHRISSARVVVATMSSLVGSADIFRFGAFSTAIIDEASQLTEPLVMAVASRVQKLIFIGDHAQLPPIITQQQADLIVQAPILHAIHINHLGGTTFERLFTAHQANHWTTSIGVLREQGRMHQDVMVMPSTMFYHGSLEPVQPWQRDSSPLPWHAVVPYRAAMVPVVATRPEEQQALEVAMITHLLRAMIGEDLATQHGEWSFGVITPFRVQNHAIVSSLPPDLRAMVTVDTVERFQGSQRDVIIYGTAVALAADLRSITSEAVVDGKLVDRKLNVASTRARHQFILVGHPDVLAQTESYARALELLPSVYLQDTIDLHDGRS